MSVVVELGDAALINLWDLGHAIARVGQVVAEGAVGVDCVTMKTWDTGIPRSFAGSLDGCTADLDTSGTNRKTLWNSSKLSDEERLRLTELLPQLPELRYPMGGVQREQFLKAYRKLVHGRWNWEPVLWTEDDAARHEADERKNQLRAINALRETFEDGKLFVCDANHVPIKRIVFTSECFVSKRTAIEYLERIGVLYQDVSREPKVGQTLPKESSGTAPRLKPSGDVSKTEMGRRYARRPEWTVQRYVELAEFHREHGTKASAARFFIGERQVRKRLAAWKDHPQHPKKMIAAMAGGPMREGAAQPPRETLS